MYWFTADQHFNHKNIIKYCNRPFKTVEEMDETLITNFNEVVKPGDVTIHAGDFCFDSRKEGVYRTYVKPLNGTHIFLRGSHDRWLPKSAMRVWTKTIEGRYVVVCHYAMRVWEKSNYGSWMLFGHSHGRLEPYPNQWDVGVDNNNYYPVSFEQLKEIMKGEAK